MKGTQPRKPPPASHTLTLTWRVFFISGLKSFTKFKFIRFGWILFCSHFFSPCGCAFSPLLSLTFRSYVAVVIFYYYFIFNHSTSLCVKWNWRGLWRQEKHSKKCVLRWCEMFFMVLLWTFLSPHSARVSQFELYMYTDNKTNNVHSRSLSHSAGVELKCSLHKHTHTGWVKTARLGRERVSKRYCRN